VFTRFNAKAINQMQNEDHSLNRVKRGYAGKKVVFEIIYKRKNYKGM